MKQKGGLQLFKEYIKRKTQNRKHYYYYARYNRNLQGKKTKGVNAYHHHQK